MQSAPGYRKAQGIMHAYHSELLPMEPVCFLAHFIPSDQEQDAQEQLSTDNDDELYRVTTVSEGDDDVSEDALTPTTAFDLDNVAIIEDNQNKALDELYSKDPSAALLHWHYQLRHLPFKTIQAMAHQQQLPKELVTEF